MAEATPDDLLGSDAEQRSSGASEDGDTLVLSGSPGKLEYALYRFNQASGIPEEIQVQIDGAGSADVWIALANFTTNRWDFFGPYATVQTITVGDPDYVSPNGNTWVAIVVTNAGAARIEAMRRNPRNWIKLTVEEGLNFTPGPGQFAALEVVDGRPAIAHCDGQSGQLKFTICEGPTGIDPWNAQIVADFATDSSLAVVDGRPAISFHDYDALALKYAINSEPDGSGSWNIVVVDDSSDSDEPGWYSCLKVINGHPAIAYMDGVSTNLRYAWSSQPDGSSGWSTLTVDESNFTGEYNSLAEVNGAPAISYLAGGTLRYAYSSHPDGASGWNSVIVDADEEYVGRHTSLAVVAGKPAIAYMSSFDQFTQRVKYAWCDEPNGSAGWHSLFVDPEAHGSGLYASLEVIAGRPAISYQELNTEQLRFATTHVPDGSAGWERGNIDDDGGVVGQWSSLAVVDGTAAIAYVVDDDLKYITYR